MLVYYRAMIHPRSRDLIPTSRKGGDTQPVAKVPEVRCWWMKLYPSPVVSRACQIDL